MNHHSSLHFDNLVDISEQTSENQSPEQEKIKVTETERKGPMPMAESKKEEPKK